MYDRQPNYIMSSLHNIPLLGLLATKLRFAARLCVILLRLDSLILSRYDGEYTQTLAS